MPPEAKKLLIDYLVAHSMQLINENDTLKTERMLKLYLQHTDDEFLIALEFGYTVIGGANLEHVG